MSIKTTSPKVVYFAMDFSRDPTKFRDKMPIQMRLGWALGFRKALYDTGKSYTAESIIEPATTRYIYLMVDDFNNSVNDHYITAFNEGTINKSILARIAVKSVYFSIIMENDGSLVSEPRSYFGPVDIQRLHIKLFDDYGRTLDMNGSDISFSLSIKMLYDM